MNRTPSLKMLRSPWSVVEVFLIFLVASLIGEFMGASIGEGSQTGLALAELAIGLALAWPVFSGNKYARWGMAAYLLYYGLCTFWLLMDGGADTITWIYHLPLALYFAAGGLKLLFTPMQRPDPGGSDDQDTDASDTP